MTHRQWYMSTIFMVKTTQIDMDGYEQGISRIRVFSTRENALKYADKQPNSYGEGYTTEVKELVLDEYAQK